MKQPFKSKDILASSNINLNDQIVIRKLFFSIVLYSVICTSCEKGNSSPDNDDNRNKLIKIEDALSGDNQNIKSILEKVRGSVGKRGPGSKTIWSRKNDYGLGIYVSANHVLGIEGWGNKTEEFVDLTTTNNGIFLTSKLPPTTGSIEFDDSLVADFPFYHSNISTSATNTTLVPEEDFYVGVVDNQKIKESLFSVYPEMVQTNTPLFMYDPYNRTKENKTWDEAVPDEYAILVGYPHDVENYPNGAVLYSKILTDTEAEQAIIKLKDAGDAEGNISYKKDVEFFVHGKGISGMSGGGVFNSQGQCLGIMVRASNTNGAPEIIRVIRIAFIHNKLIQFYQSLPENAKSKFIPFLRGEIL